MSEGCHLGERPQRDTLWGGSWEVYMAQSTLFLLLAIFLILLIPITPRMIRLRMKVLNWLKLKGLANFIERNFNLFVTISRVVFALIAVVLLVLAFA